MISNLQRIQILDLYQKGFSATKIAKKCGISIATAYKYKRIYENQSESIELERNFISENKLPKKLEQFKNTIKEQVKLGVLNNTKIFQILKEQGYVGSYGTLNSYLKVSNNIIGKYKRAKHVETEPGEQAQVDWGYFGKILIDEREEHLYAFVYVLSYSRAMYVEFVIKQNLQTFEQCHINAFEKLGIPKKILYDNVKTVIIKREKNIDGETKYYFNNAFLDFAKYYGFSPTLCPLYWPRAKGKVEAGVKYLRNNFSQGLLSKKNVISLEDLNSRLGLWIKNIAEQRKHPSINCTPHEKWISEKPFLCLVSSEERYQAGIITTVKATKDSNVQYGLCCYDVPTFASLKKLQLREVNIHGVTYLQIYYQGVLIRTHQKSTEKGKWITDDSYFLEEIKDKFEGKVQHINSKKIRKNRAIELAVRDLSYYDY